MLVRAKFMIIQTRVCWFERSTRKTWGAANAAPSLSYPMVILFGVHDYLNLMEKYFFT